MATFLNAVISNLLTQKVAIGNVLSLLTANLSNAGISLEAGNTTAAGGYLRSASTNVDNFKMELVQLSGSFLQLTRTGFSLVQSNWPSDGAEFDMDILLTAMLSATNPQLEYFIGLVDAYRQALWNKPFNSEFFGALARGFEQWD